MIIMRRQPGLDDNDDHDIDFMVLDLFFSVIFDTDLIPFKSSHGFSPLARIMASRVHPSHTTPLGKGVVQILCVP